MERAVPRRARDLRGLPGHVRGRDEVDDGGQRDLPPVRRRDLGAASLSPGRRRAAARAGTRPRSTVALAGMALFFVGRFGPGGRGDSWRSPRASSSAGLILSLKREKEGGAEAAVAWGNVVAVAALLPLRRRRTFRSRPRSAAILGFLGVFQLAFAYILFVRGPEARDGHAGLAHRHGRAGRATRLGVPRSSESGRASTRIAGGAIVLGADRVEDARRRARVEAFRPRTEGRSKSKVDGLVGTLDFDFRLPSSISSLRSKSGCWTGPSSGRIASSESAGPGWPPVPVEPQDRDLPLREHPRRSSRRPPAERRRPRRAGRRTAASRRSAP